jgi:glucose/arabinose dehydrogenase
MTGVGDAACGWHAASRKVGSLAAMNSSPSLLLLAAMSVAALGVTAAIAQQKPDQKRKPASVEQVISPDQEMGKQFQVLPSDLPQPRTGPIVSNKPLTVPYKGQTLKVPEGFTAAPFVTDLEHPRRLLVLPNGDVIVAEQKVGHLTLLRDEDGDGKADWIERHAENFQQPYGLAWREGEILVADQQGIWKVPHKLGDVRTGSGENKKAAEVPPKQRKPSLNVNAQELVTQRGVFGLVKGHANRPLAVDPKTGALFVGVGSSGNIGVEPEVKATIQRFEADGSRQTTFVSGARNVCGLTIHPETGELWGVVQERDGLGDGLVPDFLIRAEHGAFYGWPYAYIGQNPQPGFAQRAPEKVKASKIPDLLFEAHSSAMDLVFYTGEQFPAEYRGDLFVVLKGSWNRSQPTGYKVVRARFRDGRPQGGYENFATGFWVSGKERAEVWGRPAAIAVAKDGSLLIADDTAGTIWRIAYSGPSRRQADKK